MASNILWLIVGLTIILLGAEVFTNAVEWVGRKLNLGAGAVGSVLAAVGTALPETLVPVVAIFRGFLGGGAEMDSHDVGIGAILGAPFMLGTLAMFLTGITAFIVRKRRNTRLRVASAVMGRDLFFFIVVYAVAILASFVPVFWKPLIAAGLVTAYLFYVYVTVKGSVGKHDGSHKINPLYLMRESSDPSFAVVVLQLTAALGIIISGAVCFVNNVEVVAEDLGIPALLLALIVTPIATELPEKFNSIIWVSRGQDTMALGNITGAMVFQSSLLPALGIMLTPWRLGPVELLSAALALSASVWLFVCLKRTKSLTPVQAMLCGLLYLVFFVYVIVGMRLGWSMK